MAQTKIATLNVAVSSKDYLNSISSVFSKDGLPDYEIHSTDLDFDHRVSLEDIKSVDLYLSCELDEIEELLSTQKLSEFIDSYVDEIHTNSDSQIEVESYELAGELEEAQKADQFNYMMLGRLKQDCDYFLGNGNGHEKHLWADSVEDHIKEMEKLHNAVRFKPDYLAKEDIQKYKTDMCKLKLEQEKDNPNFITEKNLPFYYEAMSDNQKFLLANANDIANCPLTQILKERGLILSNQFSFKSINEKLSHIKTIDYDSKFVKKQVTIGMEYFGIKDTLKPIDKYIAEIEKSPDFQKYVTSNVLSKIQNNEVVAPSEYSKIDLESEAFKSLDSEVQTTITDYINEQSDKIVNAALEEEKLKQEQSFSIAPNV